MQQRAARVRAGGRKLAQPKVKVYDSSPGSTDLCGWARSSFARCAKTVSRGLAWRTWSCVRDQDAGATRSPMPSTHRVTCEGGLVAAQYSIPQRLHLVRADGAAPVVASPAAAVAVAEPHARALSAVLVGRCALRTRKGGATVGTAQPSTAAHRRAGLPLGCTGGRLADQR